MNSSANKVDIIDASEQIMLSITRVTRKKETIEEKRLADYYKKFGEKSTVKFDSLDRPQILLQNT